MVLLAVFLVYAVLFSVALARAGLGLQPTGPPAVPRPSPKRLLIVGATGGTGRQLVAQALGRGFEVTALVRNPARLAIPHRHLTILQGDVLDYAAVEAAVRGQDAVLSALGHTHYFPPTQILSRGTANILRAMESSGAPRFVCETSLGIGDSAG